MSDGHVVYGDGAFVAKSAFAPAERASRSEVEANIAALSGHPLLQALLDAADVSVVVLNRQRQILVGNSVLLAGLGAQEMQIIEGLRPGEALGCALAWKCQGGCGTSPECAACGAVMAIVESQRTGATVERDCLMTLRKGEAIDALELRVRASRLAVGSEAFTIVGIRDISAEKRRDALERVFLHDISNTVGPLLNWAHVSAARASGDSGDVARRILALAKRLQREIEDQRVLLQAEKGTLQTERAAVHPEAVLEAAAGILEGHSEASGRKVEIIRGDTGRTIATDESLLVRILVNMVKNALEATPEGGVVKAWVEHGPAGCELRVWNAGTIARDIAIQVFKRSFSTKSGRGRGLGTFSMKLFGERYLGGVVGFTSTDDEGTTFFIRLPAGQ
jgi:hypothetical protein